MSGTGARQRQVAFLALLAAAVAGCSTSPVHRSERKGLLDRMTEAKPDDGRRPSAVESSAIGSSASSLGWPLKDVKVTSNFGRRSKGFHEGIDLRAAPGTPVYAAEAGTVLYADKRIRGYGRMIVISHPGNVATVYAHNSKTLVRKGQKVARGQKIAVSGSTGRATGPHLHFEVREGVTAVDPLRFLPSKRLASN